MKLYPRFSKYSSGWQDLKEISVIIYSPVRPLSAWIYLLEVREQLLNIYILLTQGRRIKVKDFIGLQHFRVRFSPSLKCSSLARDYSCVKCSMTNNLILCFETCVLAVYLIKIFNKHNNQKVYMTKTEGVKIKIRLWHTIPLRYNRNAP